MNIRIAERDEGGFVVFGTSNLERHALAHASYEAPAHLARPAFPARLAPPTSPESRLSRAIPPFCDEPS